MKHFLIVALLLLCVAASAAPVITSFSTGSAVPIGGRITLAVVVSGTPPFSFVWKKNGVQLANSTNELHTIYIFQASDAGSYVVTVSDLSGSASSLPAVLTVAGVTPPPIPLPPVEKTVPFGAAATLRAAANGTPLPAYQWFHDGVKVAEGANLPFGSATETHAGIYVCRASNGIGPGAESAPIRVFIAQAPVITSPFPNVALVRNQSHTFSVTAYGPNVRFKWQKGSIIIPGATLPSYSIAKFNPNQDVGSYMVTAYNDFGAVSATAKVTVR